ELYHDNHSFRTIHHPEGVRPYLSSDRLVLVTSAYHMPRSLWMFRDAGYDPIPCPAELYYDYKVGWADFLPGLFHMRALEAAWSEYLKLFQYTFERHM
ncbi:hypothetical protein GF324_03490, partial [bacterium]|nr:hypothetical protein [bacterium]